jgi:CheY-like chemotaxis protein
MPREINCILLIDDDPDDNFLHQLVIEESQLSQHVKVAENGPEALAYLNRTEEAGYIHPDVIFLDINMPGMNGFEFLREYEKLPKPQQPTVVLMMLTTSLNPDDEKRARSYGAVSSYRSKPLTRQMLDEIHQTYF